MQCYDFHIDLDLLWCDNTCPTFIFSIKFERLVGQKILTRHSFHCMTPKPKFDGYDNRSEHSREGSKVMGCVCSQACIFHYAKKEGTAIGTSRYFKG